MMRLGRVYARRFRWRLCSSDEAMTEACDLVKRYGKFELGRLNSLGQWIWWRQWGSAWRLDAVLDELNGSEWHPLTTTGVVA